MFNKKSYKTIGALLPLVLLATTWAAFHFFNRQFGEKTGYLSGFVFYWIFWCTIVPLIFLNKGEIKSLFAVNYSLFRRAKTLHSLCLVIPLLLAYGYAFPKAISFATIPVLLLSLLLSLVNAPLEELLWRGLYLKLFASDKRLYVICSSLGFAIWHFAPQTIFPNKAPGGQLSFVAVAFGLGLLFSIVAKNTNSILLTTISHILFDFSGLGGRLYC